MFSVAVCLGLASLFVPLTALPQSPGDAGSGSSTPDPQAGNLAGAAGSGGGLTLPTGALIAIILVAATTVIGGSRWRFCDKPFQLTECSRFCCCLLPCQEEAMGDSQESAPFGPSLDRSRCVIQVPAAVEARPRGQPDRRRRRAAWASSRDGKGRRGCRHEACQQLRTRYASAPSILAADHASILEEEQRLRRHDRLTTGGGVVRARGWRIESQGVILRRDLTSLVKIERSLDLRGTFDRRVGQLRTLTESPPSPRHRDEWRRLISAHRIYR